MKSKILCSLCILGMFFTMAACGNDEVAKNPETEQKEEEIQITSATCEILVSSDFMCEEPLGQGIYTVYEQWEKAMEDVDVEVVLERKDMYDETFFEDKALIYLVDCSSGGAQFQYEGCNIETTEDSTKLTIQISGSTEHLLNTIHAYHVFFVIDKKDAEKIDEAELSKSWRD